MKVTFIHALVELGVKEVASPVTALLSDSCPAVRQATLEALPKRYPKVDTGIRRLVQPLLSDADFAVRAQALVSLAVCEEDEPSARRLADMLHDPIIEHRLVVLHALEVVLGAALAQAGNNRDTMVVQVIPCLDDRSAAVREAACRALRCVGSERTLGALVEQLSDSEPSVRIAAAQSLSAAGALASPYVLSALQVSPTVDHDAALGALSPDDLAIREPLRDYAQGEIERLRQWRTLYAIIPTAGRVRVPGGRSKSKGFSA